MSLALVLAGGRLVVTPRVLEAAAPADLVVAADGGAVHAAVLGRRPDVWVGDFDSSPPALEAALAGVPRESHPRDKARVDTELALEAARDRGATGALVLGALGGRFDHALALLLVAARLGLEGFPVALDSGDEAVHLLAPGGPLRLPLEPGQVFSVLALGGPVGGLTVAGARWPLAGVEMPSGVGWGVSNEALGPVALSLTAGVAAVVVQYPAE